MTGCDGRMSVRIERGGSWMVRDGCFLDLKPITEAKVLNFSPVDCLMEVLREGCFSEGKD